VVGVSLDFQPLGRRIVDHYVNAILFGISDRRLLAREPELDLPARIAAAGPAHQRIGLLGLRRNEVENPLVGERLAGLHGVLGALEDTGLHGTGLSFGCPAKSRGPFMPGPPKHRTRCGFSGWELPSTAPPASGAWDSGPSSPS